MPSFTPHLLVPVLIILATRLVPARVAFALAPLTLVPDLDYFIPPHRAFTGSIWWPLLAGLLAWRLHAHHDGRWVHAAIGTFYLTSHALMDVFAGGVVLFWPLLDTTFFLDLAIVVDTATNTPTLIAGAGTESGPPRVSSTYVWFSRADAAMWAVALASGVTWWFGRRLSIPWSREADDEQM